MIIIIGCFAQSLAGQAHAVNVIAVIIVWRGIVSLQSNLAFILRFETKSLLDGHRNRWGLPIIGCHLVRVLLDEDTRPPHDRRLRIAGLGQLQCVHMRSHITFIALLT